MTAVVPRMRRADDRSEASGVLLAVRTIGGAGGARWRAPDDPARVREAFDLGDPRHGNDAGYRARAESIDLGLFDGWTASRSVWTARLSSAWLP